VTIPVKKTLAAARHLLPDPSRWDLFDVPEVDLPEGRWLDLPRRGRTWLTDVPGPTPDAPVIVLLHAVGCTGQLTWFPAIPELAKHFRVITFDQRWHGRGIMSERFLVTDCADDVAAVIKALRLDRPIVAGYSMGSVVAQRVWRQHPESIGGLILAASTAHFRTNGRERVFHAGMEVSMRLSSTLSRSAAINRATAATVEAIDADGSDTARWAMRQFRSTSAWAVGQAVASLGRHHSSPWLTKVDVPTAIVVTAKDHVIPPDRQLELAELIPDATVHQAQCGHAGCVLEYKEFVPVFVEAALDVAARAVRDRQPA
jgi:pimeloyl-ACP methyl ester carboxylesterase